MKRPFGEGIDEGWGVQGVLVVDNFLPVEISH